MRKWIYRVPIFFHSDFKESGVHSALVKGIDLPSAWV